MKALRPWTRNARRRLAVPAAGRSPQRMRQEPRRAETQQLRPFKFIDPSGSSGGRRPEPTAVPDPIVAQPTRMGPSSRTSSRPLLESQCYPTPSPVSSPSVPRCGSACSTTHGTDTTRLVKHDWFPIADRSD